MFFDQIADLKLKKQGRLKNNIIDCCTKLDVDRSQVEKNSSVSIHNRNLLVLVTKMFKTNRGISLSITKGIFEPKAEHSYNLRCIFQFSAPLVSTVFHGTENISFFGPKIWSLLPENFKNIDSLENFKILIKKWKPVKLSLKAMQGLHKNVGSLCSKKLCIISQDNILTTKFKIFRSRFFSSLFHQKIGPSTALWWQESYVFKQYSYSCGFVWPI